MEYRPKLYTKLCQGVVGVGRFRGGRSLEGKGV